MPNQSIKSLLASEGERSNVVARGWVRTRRDAKACSFIELNDGSCAQSLQVVVPKDIRDGAFEKAGTGAAIAAAGSLVASQGKNQAWELAAESIDLIGETTADYPLQKKGHSLEFLREIAHLRPRTNVFGAALRIRGRLANAVHQFFLERDFVNLHTPIITANDCEGAGELFRVTTIDPAAPPMTDGRVDYGQDFFGQPTYLTVSGQLQAEAFACALSKVYTFGPTFRAENSHTSRHASEFWMIEPEMAFYDLADNATLAVDFVQSMAAAALKECEADLKVLQRFVDKDNIPRLETLASVAFERIAYTDAIKILEASGRAFEHPVQYGLNLQSEHERYLCEEHVKRPVVLINYPKEIKPFYMRLNDDGATVAAMDVLAPHIGEIVGGSQREERLDVLLANMKEHHLPESDYAWYADLRRYGSVPHSGFGVGFERLLMLVTGLSNIRDVIPFHRTPGHARF